MSDTLRDEVEAINSIYGEGCLVSSPEAAGVHVLDLPGGSSSVRLFFPTGYPDEPPSVVGTHSSGELAKRGDAARELALFVDALGNVFRPGEVCVFDAIEEFSRLLESRTEMEASAPPENSQPDSLQEAESSLPNPLELPSPPWILSDPLTELRSTFVARVAPATSTSQAAGYVQHLLASDKRVRSATHNITAWRIRGTGGTSFQDCDDDGETAAGGRLLHLMQLMDLWDVVVVVTRWYGGHKLGPRRFALINSVARDAFLKAGLVTDAPGAKKKGQGK